MESPHCACELHVCLVALSRGRGRAGALSSPERARVEGELGRSGTFPPRGLTALDAAQHTPTHFIIRECPFCTRPHRNKADNLWKLYIKREDGAFFCHRCGSRGSMFDLKAKVRCRRGCQDRSAAPLSRRPAQLGDLPATTRFSGKPHTTSFVDAVESALIAREAGDAAPESEPRLPDNQTAASYCHDLIEGRQEEVLTYLTKTRGLSTTVLRKYGVGASHFSFRGDAGWEHHPCIVFPWLISQEQLATAKVRAGWRAMRVDGAWQR